MLIINNFSVKDKKIHSDIKKIQVILLRFIIFYLSLHRHIYIFIYIMKKNSKRLFSLAIFLKLFLMTSLTAGNPVSITKSDDSKVTVVYPVNDTSNNWYITI
jgi:hypothetical protein